MGEPPGRPSVDLRKWARPYTSLWHLPEMAVAFVGSLAVKMRCTFTPESGDCLATGTSMRLPAICIYLAQDVIPYICLEGVLVSTVNLGINKHTLYCLFEKLLKSLLGTTGGRGAVRRT